MTAPDPATLRAGLAAQGFAWAAQALAPALFAGLRDEAERLRPQAETASDEGEVTYRSRIAGLGPAAQAFLSGPEARALLQAAFGEPLVLSDDASCYTFYGEGDSLGLHRDTPGACAATLILYLAVTGADTAAADTGLVLRIHGETRPGPGELPVAVIPTRPATLVLGWGARFWHTRPPLRRGEAVSALTACYRYAGL